MSPPNSRIARDPEVRRAADSVVKVLGTACGLGVQGSGWIAGDDVVVTNAHVVAGQDDTTVQVGGEGDRVDAEAIWFDAPQRSRGPARPRPRRPGSEAEPERPAGRLGGDPGLSGERPLRRAPGRLGQTSTVVTQDAYGRGPVERRITSLRGPRALGQLGRTDGGRVGAGRHDDLRRVVSDGGRAVGVPDEIVSTPSTAPAVPSTPAPAPELAGVDGPTRYK